MRGGIPAKATMKVKLNELLSEAHGKICGRKGAPILAYSQKFDVQYAYHTHKVNPRIANPTDTQATKRKKFQNTITLIKQTRSKTSDWEAMREAFKAQTKYKTLWNFAFSRLYPQATSN